MQTIHDEIIQHLPHAEESRRLFHGRGHCFAGYEDLLIDYFPPVVMVTLYQKRPQAWLEELTEMLTSTLPEQPQAILLQERFLLNGPCRLLHGTLPEDIEAREAGLSFRLRLGEAQNIGFFPDMAVGRKLVREHTVGKRVLNLFAYSCSFSVAALAGGATQVVNLDMNRGALELGKRNHQLNNIDLRKASFLPLEFFRSLSKLKKIGPFDLVICDPPASQGKSSPLSSTGQSWCAHSQNCSAPVVKYWLVSTPPTSALTISTACLPKYSPTRKNLGCLHQVRISPKLTWRAESPCIFTVCLELSFSTNNHSLMFQTYNTNKGYKHLTQRRQEERIKTQ